MIVGAARGGAPRPRLAVAEGQARRRALDRRSACAIDSTSPSPRSAARTPGSAPCSASAAAAIRRRPRYGACSRKTEGFIEGLHLAEVCGFEIQIVDLPYEESDLEEDELDLPWGDDLADARRTRTNRRMTRRTDRIANVLLAELARLLRQEVTDPRIGLVSLSRVDVAPDLSNAIVYYSTIGEVDDDARRGPRRRPAQRGAASCASAPREGAAAQAHARLRVPLRPVGRARCADPRFVLRELSPDEGSADAGRSGRSDEGATRSAQTRGARADAGFLVVDKPKGWTSHDVVDAARGWLGGRQIGHLGTLDPARDRRPAARRARRRRSSTASSRTAARATRVASTSASRPTRSTRRGRNSRASRARCRTRPPCARRSASFLGEIEQIPPMFSAVKQGGVPLHKLAREGRRGGASRRRSRSGSIASSC